MYDDLAVARLIVLSLQCYLDWLWNRSAQSDEEWETYRTHLQYLETLESAAKDPNSILENFRDVADNFGDINDSTLQQMMVEAVKSVNPPCKTFSELYQRICRGLLANSLAEIANALVSNSEAVTEQAVLAHRISEQLRLEQEIPWELLEDANGLSTWLELFLEAEAQLDEDDEAEEPSSDEDDSDDPEDPFGLLVGLPFAETEFHYDLSAAFEADEELAGELDLDDLERLAVLLEEDINRVLNTGSPESMG